MDWVDFLEFMFLEDFNFFWIFAVIILTLLSLDYLRRAKNPDLMQATKIHYIGYAEFMFIYGISRVVFWFRNYYREHDISMDASILAAHIAYILGMVSISALIYVETRYMLGWERWAIVFPVINVVIACTLPFEILQPLSKMLMPIYLILVVFAYLKVARNTTGELRKNAIKSSFGLLIFYIGVFFDSTMFKEMFDEMGMPWVVFVFAPLIFIAGLLIFWKGSLRKD
jgi:hypothetical protein